MMRLVSFTTASGEDVAVQVPDDGPAQAGPVTRGWVSDHVEENTEKRLDDALAKVQPAVGALIAQARSLVDTPNEIEVQFGIQLSVEVGAFITASSTSNFRVTMTWRSPPAQ
jgi:hypothetical protein